MVPMCATCRWYDPVTDEEYGTCSNWPMVDTEAEDGPEMKFPTTWATNRCSDWGNATPTRAERVILAVRTRVRP